MRGGERNQAPSISPYSLSSLHLLEMENLLAGYRKANRASGGGQSLFILFLERPVLVTFNIEMFMLALTFLSNFLFPEKSSLTVPFFHRDLHYIIAVFHSQYLLFSLHLEAHFF